MERLLAEFELNDSQLKTIYERFVEQVKKGLAKATHEKADIKCFVTYVQHLPTGRETGSYMALDLGGTNFRVLLVTLNGTNPADVEQKNYKIPKEVMVGEGVKLFDYIAKCIADFVTERQVVCEKLPLGFTFSFPCVQKGLAKEYLVKWTKGFNCSGVINQDVGQLLKEAIARRGDLDIHVTAIVNDTIGTLMSCAHRTSECRIGLIVGTGCNASYVERACEAELLEDEYKDKSDIIVVNSELGAFGESGALDFIRTKFDREMDKNSINPGSQLFEKMISGLYLGELVRYLLMDAFEEKLVFKNVPNRDEVSKALHCGRGIFKTWLVSDVEGDTGPEYKVTKKVLREFCKVENADIDDCKVLQLMCSAVSKRAGSLVAVALSGLINRINEPKVAVGIDGAVYRFHPKFEGYIRKTLQKMVNPDIRFELVLAEDGSGRGAALVAATARK